MPILTPEEINSLQAKVRKAIAAANPEQALVLLGEVLPASRAKHNQVVLLKARQADILQHTINNTLSEERLEVMRNNLTADLLLFIDHLVLADFEPNPAQRPGLKPGHLLYQIPTRMVLQTSYDCLVRIAEELNQVLEGLAGEEDLVIEDIGITEVMEVEILDPGSNDNPVFDIMLLSDGEQAVDEYSYTEWVFNVRPLQEGEHKLILKISVLLTVKGKERTKNIILRRPIRITAKATEDAHPLKFKRLVASTEETSSPQSTDIAGESASIDPSVPPAKTTSESGVPKIVRPPAEQPGHPQIIPPSDRGSTGSADDDYYIQEEASGPSPGEESAPTSPDPTAPPARTATGGGAPLPESSPSAPPRRPVIVRKSGRRSFLSMMATLLVLAVAGVWLAKNNIWEQINPEDRPNKVDPGDLPPIITTDTADSLRAPKRLLPDSL